MNSILERDLDYSFHNLSSEELRKLYGTTILITGCGGFLGQYYLSFFQKYGKVLNLKKVIGIDTFLLGKSALVQDLQHITVFTHWKLWTATFGGFVPCWIRLRGIP